jgi:PAB1-binding protein PBP1
MAITKAIADDKIEVVGEYKAIQIRTATIVSEDGTELSRSFHRRVLHPDADVSGESAEIRGIAAAAWTDEVKAAWQTYQENQPTLA